jgi:hypothetical protein
MVRSPYSLGFRISQGFVHEQHSIAQAMVHYRDLTRQNAHYIMHSDSQTERLAQKLVLGKKGPVHREPDFSTQTLPSPSLGSGIAHFRSPT